MHEMRKKERRLQDEETRALLRTGEYGVLATIGQDGQPYGVPMSYAFAEDHYLVAQRTGGPQGGESDPLRQAFFLCSGQNGAAASRIQHALPERHGFRRCAPLLRRGKNDRADASRAQVCA